MRYRVTSQRTLDRSDRDLRWRARRVPAQRLLGRDGRLRPPVGRDRRRPPSPPMPKTRTASTARSCGWSATAPCRPTTRSFPEPAAATQVYTMGHRNPQGIAFQPGTGRVYASEHGPNENDEINLVQPGGNYGWPCYTGTATPFTPAGCARGQRIPGARVGLGRFHHRDLRHDVSQPRQLGRLARQRRRHAAQGAGRPSLRALGQRRGHDPGGPVLRWRVRSAPRGRPGAGRSAVRDDLERQQRRRAADRARQRRRRAAMPARIATPLPRSSRVARSPPASRSSMWQPAPRTPTP